MKYLVLSWRSCGLDEIFGDNNKYVSDNLFRAKDGIVLYISFVLYCTKCWLYCKQKHTIKLFPFEWAKRNLGFKNNEAKALR